MGGLMEVKYPNIPVQKMMEGLDDLSRTYGKEKTFKTFIDKVKKLYFADKRYRIDYYNNLRSIGTFNFEWYVEIKDIKMKLCLATVSIEKHYTRDTFLNLMYDFLQEVDYKIDILNKIDKPLIYSRPPFENFKDLVELEILNNMRTFGEEKISNLDLFNCFDKITPLPFGEENEWLLDAALFGSKDIGYVDIYIEHRPTKISFVIEGLKGYIDMARVDKGYLPNFIDLLEESMVATTVQWNNYLNDKKTGLGRRDDYGERISL